MDLTFLDSVWSLAAPWRATVLGQGTNSQVVRVETAAGRYVLRLYRNHAEAGRVEWARRTACARCLSAPSASKMASPNRGPRAGSLPA
jgi:hypothetical protein